MMKNIERKHNTASPGSPDDEVEIVQIVGRVAKITISVALGVKIIKHFPSWLEAVANNPDFSILGFLLKVFLYGFVILLVLRTSYELWHDRRAQFQRSLTQFFQNLQLSFQKWANLLLVKLKSYRFRRESTKETEPLSHAYPVSHIFPIRKIKFKQVCQRPWIFRSKLENFWNHFAGKRQSISSGTRPITPIKARVESYTELPTVSEWDRQRLKQIIEANKQGFMWPEVGRGRPLYPQNTWSPSDVNEPRSEDELTLNYHRRSVHMKKDPSTSSPNAPSSKTEDDLGYSSMSYRPLSISSFPSPRAMKYSPRRRVITKARSGRQSSVFDLNKILARSVELK